MSPCQQGGTAGAADWGVDEVVGESDTLGDDVLVQARHVARVPAKEWVECRAGSGVRWSVC
jgi:hypothetical protein